MSKNLSFCKNSLLAKSDQSWKEQFLCGADQLHESFLNSPLVVIIYVFAVLFIAFLVFRSSNRGHKDE
ncbi:MAG: hypothetical protein VW452_00105 [Pelagibacteraceae bacterium]|jgi:hypothetical protein